MIFFHRFRRRTHVTPKSYLSFVNGYKTLYTEKHSYINTLAERMNVGKKPPVYSPGLFNHHPAWRFLKHFPTMHLAGLAKLMEASESVAQLSKDLVVKEKELAVASVRADKVQ